MQGEHRSSHLTYRFCARAISLLGAAVPASYRKRWVEEWMAELWYHDQGASNRLQLILRTAGAVPDAISSHFLNHCDTTVPSADDGGIAMILRDLKFASRSLLKRPGFSLLILLTLALSVGANTALFSVVNAVLLRPLPYPDADRLVKIVGFETDRGEAANLSPADFLDFEKDNQVFVSMGGHGWVGWFTVTGEGEPERVPGSRVTAGFFPTLEVRPRLGRLPSREEDLPGAPPVAVITHGFWIRRFGADGGVIGKTIGLDAVPTTIIGVLPPEYRHPEPDPEREPEIYDLHRFDPVNALRSGRFIRAVGRLERDTTVEEAQAELTTIAARLEQEYPDSNTWEGVQVRPLLDAIVSEVRPALTLLLAAVFFVLLIACTNIANLLLAVGTERRKELAIRTALGAERRHLILQLLSESLLLGLAGGGVGLVLALWGTRLLEWQGTSRIPRADELSIDGILFGFTLTIALAAAVVFGLLPALQLSRTDPQAWLREGVRRSSGGPSVQRARNLLIVAEVALSLVLLIGAGLLLQSYRRLQNTAPGFSPQRVIAMQTSLPTARYEEGEQIPFYQELHERIGSLPGVETVGAINILPLSRNYSTDGFQIDDRPAPAGQAPSAEARSINPDYFRAMGIPLLRGREFNERDTKDSPGVVIVSESMARRFWPDADPIGKRITYNRGLPEEERQEVGGTGSREIVGIVDDVKHLGLEEENIPMFYTPQTQHPSFHAMTLVIRTALDPDRITSSVRQEVWRMDKNIPVYDIQTLEGLIGKSVSAPRFRTLLLGFFAGLALLVSLTGIYSVVGYLVRQRSHEIGIRLALGARKAGIRRMLIVQGMKPVAAGLGFGLVAALAMGRALSGLLFGVTATDPVTYVTVPALLAAAALLATFLPAERATRIDPADTLRAE